MEQQYRANGRHRVLYEPRKDPVIQQLALELGRHCGKVVLSGVAAVSPNQRDPDGHRLLVASELTTAMLAEVYRMVGAVTGWAVGTSLPGFGAAVGGAAYRAVAPTPRVVQAAPRGQPPKTPPPPVRPARRAGRATTQRVPARAVVNRRGG